MARPNTSPPQWRRAWPLLLLSLTRLALAQETFTDSACRAQTTAMASCAKRWDSIRLKCKESVSTNTIWPGPCECSYYANDLPCFDDQAFCAHQVWTQVPQWFRDGVSSCIMKDASYTVRANLGSAVGAMGNPFTVPGLPGKLAAMTGAGAALPSQTALADALPQRSEELSPGAKAGFGVGIGVGVILIALAAFLLVRLRRRKKPAPLEHDAEKKAPVELHEEDAYVHMVDGKAVSEMPGSGAQRFELGVRASTWLVELPIANSMRNSRRIG